MENISYILDSPFRRLFSQIHLKALDIGARDGFTTDLLPVAPVVDAIGFEPDREECQRLNHAAEHESHPWRSLQYIPVALGSKQETQKLHIYRRRGCTSLLSADTSIAASYSRGEYYIEDATLEVKTISIDEAAEAYDFTDAAYIKIDIQGAELEVFKAAPALLDRLMAVRTEISFVPIYKNQPLMSDVTSYLRSFGFVPMRFVEMHHWRRDTRTKLPKLDNGPLPYSQGQLVHGDILYMRNPEQIPDDRQMLLEAGLLALAYEHLDYANIVFQRPATQEYLTEHNIDPAVALSQISRALARQYLRDMRRNALRQLKAAVKTIIH
jgi:FkbM family methyltransferase